MMGKLRSGLLTLRDLLASTWWIVLVVGLGFAVAYQFVKPAPPRHIVITTGSESGAYYSFAKRYAAILARDGITLEVRTSAGSRDNIERLKSDEAQVGFVQGGGIQPPEDPEAQEDEGLRSLGSVFYEPIWVFYRGEVSITRLTDLRGKRIAIGQEGSGVRQLAQQLLAANAIPIGQHVLPLAGQHAADGLLQGKVDAIFVIASEKALLVQRLLATPEVKVMNFIQAEAYRRRLPFLNKLVLPHGVADFVRDLPPHDVTLVAPAANLVVRDDLHPALQTLLLQAASEVHGKSGFFQRTGEFPAYKDELLPLSDEAARYFKSGAPFLQRYLPFWLAVLIERLVVMLVPIVALLIPLLKVAPALYRWRIRSRVFRCYGELKFLENELRQNPQAEHLAAYRNRLDAIDEEASQLHVPLGYTDLVYTLREHVNLVRLTLEKLQSAV